MSKLIIFIHSIIVFDGIIKTTTFKYPFRILISADLLAKSSLVTFSSNDLSSAFSWKSIIKQDK